MQTSEALAPFPPAVRRMMARYPRPILESLVEALIYALDTMDGDRDLEPEPDEDNHDAESETRTESHDFH